MTAHDVVLLVRDARSTEKSERILLWAIALRAKLNPKGCSAMLTYDQIAKDTGLNDNTLRRAAKKLEDAGLIRRIVRPNLPNVFSINVALLQEQAAAVADKEKDKEKEDYEDEEDYEDDTSPSLPPPPPIRRPRLHLSGPGIERRGAPLPRCIVFTPGKFTKTPPPVEVASD